VPTRGNQERAVVTGGDGTIAVPGLAVGTWTLEVSRDGFLLVRRPVVIQTTPVSVRLTLEVGGLRQSVTVEASRVARSCDNARRAGESTAGAHIVLTYQNLQSQDVRPAAGEPFHSLDH